MGILKIIQPISTELIKVRCVPFGGLFYKGETYYLRVNGNDGATSYINLENFEIGTMNEDWEVSEIEGELRFFKNFMRSPG